MHERILAISGTAIVVLIIQANQWKTVRREFRSRRMDADLVGRLVDGVGFRRGIEGSDALAAKGGEEHILIGTIGQCFDSNDLAADHDVVARLPVVPALKPDAARG